MKAALITGYGGKEVMQISGDLTKFAPPACKLLIEVRAAGVNPFDYKLREGFLKQSLPLKFPAVLGGDFSGVVEQVGSGVAEFGKGEEVYGQANIFTDGGSFAEFVIADPAGLAPKPKTINYIEAAALPLAGVSAYMGIVEILGVTKDMRILIHGGAGGIGSIAIQLAKHASAYVATTVRTEDVLFVKNLGADLVIDYQKQRFEDEIDNYDAVFDNVGGETYLKSYQVLKTGGIILSMILPPRPELEKQYKVKALAQSTQITRERLIKLADYVDRGVIKIKIDKVFPLDQAGEAMDYLQKGHPKGKVVLDIKERVPS
jgi:NADPH:quinone reductase-like Zn-dependent oxidoreductase